jgi:NADH-quinone oxidoreductase subunit I
MLTSILRGMALTLAMMFRRPVTIAYPEVKRPVAERFHGRHELKRYAGGLERCIGCALCAAACPADAILVVAGENTDAARYSPGERYAAVYEINMIRCIFCGFCAEACPVDAIVLEHTFELASHDRAAMIYTKQMLLAPPGADERPTPHDTCGQDVPFRMGGMDYFRFPESLGEGGAS